MRAIRTTRTGIVLKQMTHFIKRMLEPGIRNCESLASSSFCKVNFSTLSSGMNQQIPKKLLFQPLKWAYTFKLLRTENNFLNYIFVGFALNIPSSFRQADQVYVAVTLWNFLLASLFEFCSSHHVP